MAKKTFAKILLAAASLVLVVALTVSITIAYLTSSDSDTNVMVLGEVVIDQIEQEWGENGQLQPFTQDKPILPATGAIAWDNLDKATATVEEMAWRKFAMGNVVDKYVTVKNIGKNPAYVRTFIALEMGDLTIGELADAISMSVNAEAGSEFQFPGSWVWTHDYVAEINGRNYNIMVAVHTDDLEPGEETLPSLLQVYLKKTATHETCEKIDGNGNGRYDILVYTEAVQSEGFENEGAQAALNEAYYVPSETAHPWVNGVYDPSYAGSASELTKALNNGGDLKLTKDITVEGVQAINGELNLDLAGKNITSANGDTSGADKYSTLTVYADTVIDGVGLVENTAGYAITLRDENATLTIKGGDFVGDCTAINVSKGTLIIEGGYFEDNDKDASDDAYANGHYLINCIDSAYKNGTAKVIIKGGTFCNWNPADNASEGAGTNFVPAGYKVVAETAANGVDTLYTVWPIE
ncbi:MAG: hypothetical protein IJN63_00070 [Clostridia bacterium]|nr:hypothetical protein [Clostridia bacterium]